MSRRRTKDIDWISLAVQLAGLAMLICLISPEIRQVISALGFLFVCLTVALWIGLIGFAIYRWTTRSNRTAFSGPPVLVTATDVAEAAVNSPHFLRTDETTAPKTTTELLDELRSIDWFQFEKLVGLLCRKLDYVVTRRGGANPDGGIDLVIEKDGQSFAVQCKHWKTWNVGVKTVREFLGALTDAGMQKGIFITLGGYTGEAKQLAEKHGIEIINETGLAHMINATDAMLDPEMLFILRDKRKFCPKCESEMVLRTATQGASSGQQFWGCSAYPRCRFTMPA